ncbi:hypothetical protein C0993_009753 [Termitomyces sp. T159_Od127]|nr:hypothetical protein C0993_009753 [Termitomyces sp. T159_Od127]
MAPFSKPETVLKQAEGLVSVGQTHAALQSLTEMFTSKRFRSTPLTSLEPIMMRFVELCVDMRKGRTAKEGLMQYKNIAQNTSVQSIESVITRFVQLADAKVREAQEKAAVQSAVDVDDLEASETPESILLGAQIAQQAFKFCLKHQRKVEFRRLCETLRLHLSNVAKYSHQPHSINLSDADTLQHHLDTRFAQLNTSVELELWQEAFRSVEDVHNLLTMAKKAPRPAMMANYYEKLTKIFLMSGNALYHAAAWGKYYAIVTSMGGKTDEELSKLAGQVLVSALAVPVGLTNEDHDEVKGKNSRLTALLNLTKVPTRAGLLKDALSRDVLKLSPPSIKALYNILEVTFDPLTLCKSIAPLLISLSTTSDPSSPYAPYLTLLQRALLSRLLSQLSQVYSTITLSSLLSLVEPLRAAGVPGAYDDAQIEGYIMGCARRGELSIRVDHKSGSITFVDDAFEDTEGASTSEKGVQPTMAELRAYRKEERPLLVKDYELQQKTDRETHEAVQRARLESARAAHEEDMATKVRLARMMEDYHAHREAIVAKKSSEYAKKKEAANKKIEEEKTKRRNAVLKAREEERLRLEKEEKLRREKEEEEARIAAERAAEEERKRAEAEAAAAAAEAAKREAEEKASAIRKEREAERAAAAEQARLRLQREEEAEARARARQTEKNQPVRAPVPARANGSENVWRRPGAAAPTPRSESPASGTAPTRFINAPTAGGWRDREAKKASNGQAAPPPRTASTALPRPGASTREEPKKDEDGFQPAKQVYRPRQLRG